MRLASGAVALLLAAGGIVLPLQGPAGAQISSFSSTFCPMLLGVRDSFTNAPFFGFFAQMLSSFLGMFGCGISG